jgi:hypothetical protein
MTIETDKVFLISSKNGTKTLGWSHKGQYFLK